MKHILTMLTLALLAFPAFAQDDAQSETMTLKPVEAEYVCMVNDTLFDKPQIPVEVDGKIYYGCCMMCKTRLQKDAAIRSALDPVSGNEVDKASAVIGAMPDNTVRYFENTENMQAHAQSLSHGDMMEDHSHQHMDEMHGSEAHEENANKSNRDNEEKTNAADHEKHH